MIQILVFVLLVGFASGEVSSEEYKIGDEKIVGGDAVDIKDFYYQVSLQYLGSHFCGGIIIGERAILTAAHCLRPHQNYVGHLNVQVGTAKVGSSEGQKIDASKIYIHPQFNSTTLDYDVGVLILANDLTFTESARPIKVINTPKIPYDAEAVVSGWGYTSEEGTGPSPVLLAVKVPLISPLICKTYYKKLLTDRMICAGYAEGEKDACKGDSGGPLAIGKTLVGVVSWGKKCAQARRPGVYTHLYRVRDFIVKTAGIL